MVKRFMAPGPWITRDLKECVLASDYDALAAERDALSKDAERDEYCSRNALALDFDYGERHECVLVIRLDPTKRYPASFRAAIDAAREGT